MGEDKSWEARLITVLSWTAPALRERQWLRESGGDRPWPDVSSMNYRAIMRTFIQHEGLPDNGNIIHAVQQGRKLLEFEESSGVAGISVILIPGLHLLRRLSLREEQKMKQLLQTSTYRVIIEAAQGLSQLRREYQRIHETNIGQSDFLWIEYS